MSPRDGQIGTAGDVPFELVRAITQARGNRDHWENTQENMFCMSSLLDYAQRYEAVTPAMRVAAAVGDAQLGTAQFASVRDAAVTLEPPDRPGRSRNAHAAHDRANRRGPPLLLGAHALCADRRRRHRGQCRHRRAPRVQRAARRAVGAARATRCRFAAASSCAWISTCRCRRRATSSSSTTPCRAASSP